MTSGSSGFEVKKIMKKLLIYLSILTSLAICNVVFGQASKKTDAKSTVKKETKAKLKTKFFGKKQVQFLNSEIPLIGEIRKIGQEAKQ